MRGVRVRLMGEPTLLVDGKPVPFQTARVAALLGYLAAHRGRACPRGTIAEALWPGRDADSAHHNLRQTTLRLRQCLGDRADEALVAGRRELRLQTEGLALDIDDLVGRDRTPGSLRAAIKAYAGPFLVGIDDEWAVPVRAELAREFVRSLLDLSDILLDTAPAEALALAERAIAEEPFHDGARARKIRALRGLGEETLALREYEAYEALLADDLGLRPARVVEEALGGPAQPFRRGAEPSSESDEILGVVERSAGVAEALRLAASLTPYWIASGRPTAGLRQLDDLRRKGAPGGSLTEEVALAAARLALAAGDTGRSIAEASAALAGAPGGRTRVEALTLLADGELRRRATGEARRVALEALRLGRRLSPAVGLCPAWCLVANAHRFDGEAVRAAAAARRAQASATTPIDFARAGVLLAMSHFDAGDRATARGVLEGALSAVEADRTPAATGVRASAARTFEGMGDLSRARAGYEQAVEEHRRTENRWSLAVSLTYLGDLLTEAGEPARALPLHEEARAIRVEIGDEIGEATSLRGMANACLRMGEAGRARDPLREAIRLYGAADAMPGVASCLVRLAQAEAALGATGVARRLAHRGASLLRGMSTVVRQTIGPHSERLLPEAEALIREIGG